MTGESKQSMQNHMKLVRRIAYCVLMIVTVLFIILIRVDRLNYHNTGYYQVFPSLNIRHLTATAKEAETFFAEGNKILALVYASAGEYGAPALFDQWVFRTVLLIL